MDIEGNRQIIDSWREKQHTADQFVEAVDDDQPVVTTSLSLRYCSKEGHSYVLMRREKYDVHVLKPVDRSISFNLGGAFCTAGSQYEWKVHVSCCQFGAEC